MRNLARHRLLTYGLSGALAAGIIGGAGVVAAQTDDDGSAPPIGETVVAEDGVLMWHGGPRGIGAIIEASGLDASVFRDGFSDGKTINQILEESGVDSAAVQADVVAEFEAHLAELMDKTPPDLEEHPFLFPRALGLQEAADAIGIEVSELADALRGGQTIAEVAEANGVDVQTVIDAMVAPGLARIDEAEADGGLTAEEAADARERLIEATTDFVNEGQGAFDLHRRDGPSFHFRMGGPRGFGPGPGFDGEDESSESGETAY